MIFADRYTRISDDVWVAVGPMSKKNDTFLLRAHNHAARDLTPAIRACHCSIEMDRRQMEDLRRHITDLLNESNR